MRNDIRPGFKGDEAIRQRVRAGRLIERVEQRAEQLRAIDGTPADHDPRQDFVEVEQCQLSSARWTPWSPRQSFSGNATFTETGELKKLLLTDEKKKFTYLYSQANDGSEVIKAPLERVDRSLSQVFSELVGNGVSHDNLLINSEGIFRFLPD